MCTGDYAKKEATPTVIKSNLNISHECCLVSRVINTRITLVLCHLGMFNRPGNIGIRWSVDHVSRVTWSELTCDWSVWHSLAFSLAVSRRWWHPWAVWLMSQWDGEVVSDDTEVCWPGDDTIIVQVYSVQYRAYHTVLSWTFLTGLKQCSRVLPHSQVSDQTDLTRETLINLSGSWLSSRSQGPTQGHLLDI